MAIPVVAAIGVETLSFAVIIIGALFVFISDTCFSVIVSKLFLDPLLGVLNNNRDPLKQPSELDRRLRHTVRMTFNGTLLAVFSCSLLYVHIVMYVLFFDHLAYSPWSHPFVFSVNASSILNLVGMLMASGTMNHAIANTTVPNNISRVRNSFIAKKTPDQTKMSDPENGNGGSDDSKSATGTNPEEEKYEVNPSSCEED
jgi:hypothetical protein